MRRGEPPFEVRHELEGRAGRRVPAVQERVDSHRRYGLAPGELGERDEVAIVRVHAARSDEPDDVEPTLASSSRRAGCDERRPLEERTVGDGRIDPGQLLQHRPAGAEVQMPDLGVAHLAGRQPYGPVRSLERRVRPAGEEASPAGHVGSCNRVGVAFPADPEAVQDDEDDRMRARALGQAHEDGCEPRLRAVSAARATIPAISSGLSEAPPTSAPSIDVSARNSSIVALVTEPP